MFAGKVLSVEIPLPAGIPDGEGMLRTIPSSPGPDFRSRRMLDQAVRDRNGDVVLEDLDRIRLLRVAIAPGVPIV